jgi:hypothetical protein
MSFNSRTISRRVMSLAFRLAQRDDARSRIDTLGEKVFRLGQLHAGICKR